MESSASVSSPDRSSKRARKETPISFRRKLAALGYDKRDSFEYNNAASLQQLVSWIEDMKIRQYKVEDRGPLRQPASAAWPAAFNQYLKDLECPHTYQFDASSDTIISIIDWLLTNAINLEYRDNSQKLNDIRPQTIKQAAAAAAMASSSASASSSAVSPAADHVPIFAFEPATIKPLADELCSLLGLPSEDDILVSLKAVARALEIRFSDVRAKLRQSKAVAEAAASLTHIFTAGFSTGDEVLDRAASVLRLLYVADLRELQTKVDEILVQMQEYTANPKTDSRLGKVGR